MIKIDLFKILCDGQFHSGTDLGVQLHCSRSAVWKAIKSLQEEYSVTIFSVRGRGYRLNSRLELLDVELIKKNLSAKSKKLVNNIDVFFDINSTNDYLLSESKLNKHIDSRCVVCLSEYQRNGKGRRGKQWISPIGGNLYCSLSWNFNKSFQELIGLSIAISVGIARLLEQIGVLDVELKWPNDILWQGKKLLGILLEMHGEASGPCTAVIGIGINYQMSNLKVDIDQPWCDLNSILSILPGRNKFSAQIIDNIIDTIQVFEKEGLDAFLESWKHYDVIQNQAITIKKMNSEQQGIARGIDHTGALLVELDGKVSTVYSGDVSISIKKYSTSAEVK